MRRLRGRLRWEVGGGRRRFGRLGMESDGGLI